MAEPKEKTADEPKPHGNLTVADFMTQDVYTVNPTTTVRETINALLQKKVSSLPIVNASHTVISIVSGVDLMKFAAMGAMEKPLQSFLDKLVKTDKIVSVRKQDSFKEAFKLFLTHQVRMLVVTDGTGKLMGVVTRSAILKVLSESVGSAASSQT